MKATKNHLIRLREGELETLIKMAIGRSVDFEFGPGWTALIWNKGEPMPWYVE